MSLKFFARMQIIESFIILPMYAKAKYESVSSHILEGVKKQLSLSPREERRRRDV